MVETGHFQHVARVPVDDPRLLTFAQGLNLPDLDAAGRQRAAGRKTAAARFDRSG